MNKKTIMILLAVMVALTMVATIASASRKHQRASGDDLAKIARGGLLYDKWYKVLGMDKPKGTHPTYSKWKGKKKGSSTWRCKECHGWDYMGKKGAYKKGSHFSGIPGIRSLWGHSEAKVIVVLKNKDHQLGDSIPASDMEALAAFVSKGQFNMDRYINRGSKKAKGNRFNGERVYKTVCAKCHGMDGKKVNFGSEEKPEYVGTVAVKNPWEALHKIRMGQPGKEMPSMLAFPVQLQVDILAFTQTLPTK